MKTPLHPFPLSPAPSPSPLRGKLKPATPKARALLAKLIALADAPGTDDEGRAAEKKLARLRARYDFAAPAIAKDDLFAGLKRATRSATARQFLAFKMEDSDIAASIKWAIETETGLPALYRGDGALWIEATAASAASVGRIAGTVAENFRQLWTTYASTPGVYPCDRGNFIRGLYDGMMNDPRTQGQPLPPRAIPAIKTRAKRRALTVPAGLNVHPYSVALNLGQQIRFSVPLDQITAQLNTTEPKQIPV